MVGYVEDTGTVVEVGPRKATIRLDHSPDGSCGSCCACSAFAGGEHTLEVDRGDLQKGERVLARVPRLNQYLSIFLVFGLPLVLFSVGITVGLAFGEEKQVGSTAVLGGLAGLALAFALSWLVNRLLVSKSPPRVSRLPAPEEAT